MILPRPAGTGITEPRLGPWVAALLALVSMSTVPAAAEAPLAVPQPSAGQVANGPDGQEEILYAAPTTPDRIGRIMAPVLLNGRGPYHFVVDTGASRSTIAPRVVADLGLVPDPVRTLTLSGVTGTEEVPSVLIDRLQAGDLILTDQQLPAAAIHVFANADGILGVDGFEDMCLHADFAGNRIAIVRHRCPRTSSRWISIPATLDLGRLVRVRATIRGREIHAIIDTGAERTLGNEALLRELSLQRRADDPQSGTEVFGATSQVSEGSLVVIPALYLGGIGIRNMRVTFGNFHVFRLWGLVDDPAILVGMDVLGTVDGLMIDYARGELRILPKGSGSLPPPTGTRIRE